MIQIDVPASKKYKVYIGKNLLCNAGGYAEKTVGCGSALIITDDNVDALYGGILLKSLSESGYTVYKYVVPNGEGSKSFNVMIGILDFLAERHFTRGDAVFALGGGVVGDLAGFAASVFLRGVKLVQLPTTLLAAVDSSVGGKTAVNLRQGKNLAGSFYQPDLVMCDYGTLSTLPETVFSDGCAEVIKYGMIADKGLLELCKNGIHENLEEIISRCVSIKRDVVCGDERDTGIRQILNFGHTVGHAIELCSDYKISHGSAVAAGMAVITNAALKSGKCGRSCAKTLGSLLKKYGLPSKTEFGAEQLYNAALSDKKRLNDKITLVMPVREGEAALYKTDTAELRRLIELGLDNFTAEASE